MDTKYTLFIFAHGSTTDRVRISSGGDHPNYIINRLVYGKGLFSPNSVDVEIKVTGNPDINATFASKSAELSVYAEKDNAGATHEICKDYIVYQFRIVSEASTKTVHLTLFSRDKLLTLDKFSRVYLNQRLGLNIIEDSLKVGGILEKCKVGVLTDSETKKLDIKRLQFLYYQAKTNTFFEAIQPYRVQYNEDFYSFISRVACQCGEALFFEDGVLTLGPDPASTNPTEITKDDIYRIEYPAVEDSQLAVNDYHRNFLKDDAALKETDLPYSDCEAFDEYYDIFNEDKLPDSMGSEFYWPDIANLVIKGVAPAIGIAAASYDAVTSIEKGIKAAKEGAVITGRYATNCKYVNDQYKKNVFDDASKKTNNYEGSQQKNDKDLCQFADVFSGGQLMHDRLADIRKREMTAAKQTITVQIITHSCARLKLKLGTRVTLGKNTTVYVITACRGDFSITQNKDITEIEIVPLQTLGNKSIFVPPYNKCAEFTPVQPQTAIVSDAADPRFWGRVRVRYPWQIGEIGSPWVRVLTPFSSASGCIHFQPKAGDEVMIGYVGGNIERPYVIGSLFGNKNEKIHDNLFAANNNTVRVGSQRLDFREGSMNEFISSFFPAWGFVTQFIPGFALNLKTEHSSGWHGKTRLTDAYSFWKIEGNTAARAVTIDSAWGKVTISAYTGIDIEAVGDVTIKGKNINIKAQNNVTIESGIALKNARKSKDSTGGEKALNIISDVVSDFLKLDLSFIRTIWESVVPPKEGTLKIKSNRYLMLEAGKNGSAIDSDISDGATHKQFAPKDTSVVGKAVSDLEKIFGAVGYYADNMVQQNTSLMGASAQLSAIIDRLKLTNGYYNNNLRDIADIKNALKTQKVEDLPDFENINRIINGAVILDGAIEYGAGGAPADWIAAARELKRALNAHDKAFKKKALNKELEAVNNAIISKVSEILSQHAEGADYHLTVDDKNKVYQAACTQYIDGKFALADDQAWTNRVNGLRAVAEIKQGTSSFGMTLLNKTILDSLMTGSDYEPKAYTDSQATNLCEGKIIMSYDKNVSLVVEQNNEGDGSGQLKRKANNTLEGVKNALKKTFVVQQPNEEIIPNLD